MTSGVIIGEKKIKCCNLRLCRSRKTESIKITFIRIKNIFSEEQLLKYQHCSCFSVLFEVIFIFITRSQLELSMLPLAIISLTTCKHVRETKYIVNQINISLLVILYANFVFLFTLSRMGKSAERPTTNFFLCNFYERRNQPPKLSDFQIQPFCHTGVKFPGHTQCQSQIIELEPSATQLFLVKCL